jgi:hypothetical protein
VTGRGQASDWEKPERLAFSFIHKWNFLFPIGRLGLNVVVGAFALALIGFMALLGLRMDIIRRLRTRGQGRRLSEELIASHVEK